MREALKFCWVLISKEVIAGFCKPVDYGSNPSFDRLLQKDVQILLLHELHEL